MYIISSHLFQPEVSLTDSQYEELFEAVLRGSNSQQVSKTTAISLIFLVLTISGQMFYLEWYFLLVVLQCSTHTICTLLIFLWAMCCYLRSNVTFNCATNVNFSRVASKSNKDRILNMLLLLWLISICFQFSQIWQQLWLCKGCVGDYLSDKKI